MYCPKCGTENPDQAKFCGSCGAAINIVRDEPKQDFKPNIPASQDVSSELKIGIIIVTIFIAPLGIIMGLIYLNDYNPSKKAAGKIWLIVGIASALLWCVLFYDEGCGTYYTY